MITKLNKGTGEHNGLPWEQMNGETRHHRLKQGVTECGGKHVSTQISFISLQNNILIEKDFEANTSLESMITE